MIKVRPMQPEDMQQVSAVAEAYVQELDKGDGFSFNLVKLLVHLLSASENPSELLLVVEKEGVVIGGFWASCANSLPYADGLQAYDRLLFIDKKHRGGSGFIKIARKYIEWATEKGCDEMYLSSVSNINPDRTERLFRKLGFCSVGFVTVKKLK